MSRTEEHGRRPSPEALLQAASQEHRSRLKIFAGAAPGVGKTYAMLQAAQERRAEGVDVVVGVVETHGRQETAALLHDLEVVPKKRSGTVSRTRMPVICAMTSFRLSRCWMLTVV